VDVTVVLHYIYDHPLLGDFSISKECLATLFGVKLHDALILPAFFKTAQVVSNL
jgi:hypothetical protein